MKTNTYRFLLSLLASTTIACATANEEPQPEPVQPVAEIGPVDTSTTDTSTTADTSVVDTMPETDRCVYPATETKACGACGTQSRFCLPEGAWTGFTACAGEKVDADCRIGEKRTNDCGKCGKQTDFCDEKTCTWTEGVCAGEGPCVEGEEEWTPASCPVAGELRKRSCDNKCQWSEYGECAVRRGWIPMAAAPSSMLGRQRHSAVWTGAKMIVWGGYNSTTSSTATDYQSDGAIYDLATDTWKLLPTSPLSGRREHVAVWTGTSMIVWGGNSNGTYKTDGASYDPSTNTWTPIATAPITGRTLAAVAWSAATGEMLVWGGCGSSTCGTVYADGAAYKPSTNTWTKLPAAPIVARGDMAYGLIGGELVVTGGRDGSADGFTDGARFDPVTRFWTKFPAPSTTVWSTRAGSGWFATSDSLFQYGGRTSTTTSTHQNGTLIYTPGVGFTSFGSPSDTDYSPSAKRFIPTVWYGGGKLYAFSGMPVSNDVAAGGLVSYDPTTGVWSTESAPGALSARVYPSVVWTGREAIIWAGAPDDLATSVSATYFKDGAIFRP